MDAHQLRILATLPVRVGSSVLAHIITEVKDLSPAYFALVMATEIVSLAADFSGMRVIAVALFGLNIVIYVILWLLTILRIFRYTPQLLRNLSDHKYGSGFFTMVAGTCILGSQFIRISGDYRVAILLWCLGIVL